MGDGDAVSHARTSLYRRHNTVTGRASWGAGNGLAPTVVVVSEQAHQPRAQRRHARTGEGAVINIPKARQALALNEPYRKPTQSSREDTL